MPSMPNIAGTGRFLGPYQFVHMNDNSSYAVGSSNGDVIMANSSQPCGGVIHALTVTAGNTSSAAGSGYTLTVDGTSSTIFLFGFTPITYLLDIGFNNSFVISNASTSGSAVLSYVRNQP